VKSARDRDGRGRADSVARAGGERVLAGKAITEAVATEAANAARCRCATDERKQLQDSDREDGSEARDSSRLESLVMDTPKPSSPLVNEHHCGNLRHKGMYVMTVPDPDEFKFYDKYDATHYWCTRTQRRSGRMGHRCIPHCTHAAGRPCCES
jgi:hypothetical protein